MNRRRTGSSLQHPQLVFVRSTPTKNGPLTTYKAKPGPLSLLGLRNPAAFRLFDLPLTVTRVEMIKALMAAGPTSRVLKLDKRPRAFDDSSEALNYVNTRVVADRLAYFVVLGACKVGGLVSHCFTIDPTKSFLSWAKSWTKGPHG